MNHCRLPDLSGSSSCSNLWSNFWPLSLSQSTWTMLANPACSAFSVYSECDPFPPSCSMLPSFLAWNTSVPSSSVFLLLHVPPPGLLYSSRCGLLGMLSLLIPLFCSNVHHSSLLWLKVKVLTLTCVIGPHITSGFQFYSFSLPFSSRHTYLLTNSLNIFKNLLKCPLTTGLPLLLPVHTSQVPDPLTLLSFPFCFQYSHICLSFMFIAYCLPFSTRIQTQDVYLICSLTYLGNEKSAWSRGGNQ